MICAVCASALDLPVKTVNGKRYYYYKAQRGESVHGISKKLGLSREQIVQYNPGVADGVRRGETLYFPVEDFRETQAPVAAEDGLQPAEPLPPLPDDAPAKEAMALVALPFGLDNAAPSRQNQHSLDFYKGFLIAADTLSYRREQIEIRTVDSASGLPADSLLQTATVAILPEDIAMLDRTAERCRADGTYVLNLFAVRDTSYLSNPYMMQATIPSEIMYRKAADGLFRTFAGYTPVIIRNISGRNEKDPFTQYLAGLCDSLGRPCVRIDYNGNLTTADLAPLEANTATNFVIVPSSGTLGEFNKFAYVVRNFRDSRLGGTSGDDPEAAAPDSIVPAGAVALFGYPDWIAFRSDAEELLHAVEATVYSRYYDDYDSFASRNIGSDFVRWYGEPMIESVPSQGLLGYDAGCFIIKNMQANDGRFRPDRATEYRGVQSTFRFERVPGGGFVNTALYIVRFMPYGRMTATLQ